MTFRKAGLVSGESGSLCSEGRHLVSQRFNALFWNSYQKAKETSHRLKHSIQKILMIVLSSSGTLSTTRNPSWNNTTDCSLGHHLIPENRKTKVTIILGFYHWIWIKKFFSSKCYMGLPTWLCLKKKKTTTWSKQLSRVSCSAEIFPSYSIYKH